MQTFDQSLMTLLREGFISEDEALKNANNPNELALKLKGIDASSDRTWQSIEGAAPVAEPLPVGEPAASGGTAGGATGGGAPRRATPAPPLEGFLN